MTSSLVGSEMCIRDSSMQAHTTQRFTAQKEQTHCSPQKDPTQPPSHRPVSYTHLTLPTICSV
eukprot:12649016-Prorocentrum_lima.AAC.1